MTEVCKIFKAAHSVHIDYMQVHAMAAKHNTLPFCFVIQNYNNTHMCH